MAFFEWKPEYSGGIEGIDSQHRRIIAIMNELFEGIRAGREAEVLRKTLTELLDYANYHFALEEELFERYKYAKAEEHLAQHVHFIDTVKSLMIEDYSAAKGVPLETLHYLKTWFQDHMMKTDLEYCRFYKMRECIDEIEDLLHPDASGKAG